MKYLVLLLCLIGTPAFVTNYSNALKGKRLVLDGAICAGWEFSSNGKYADWRNEADCAFTAGDYKSRWRVQWLDNDHIVLIETEQPNEISPPRTFVYQVINIKGRKITLKSYWTGWGENGTDNEIFYIK